MILDEIKRELSELRDEQYREFMAKLIPSVDPGTVVGVRTPRLRAYAKMLAGRKDTDVFLSSLPHFYFEENQLHAFVISLMKDFPECLAATDRFLPFVDNWATCDQLSPKVFGKHKEELLCAVERWLASDRIYTVRFGIGMLMEHFLDGDFDPAYPEMVAAVRSDEYYVKMMAAWYFATALAKQYDAVIPFIEERRLDGWTHNKTIQKAIESYRISDDKKDYLRGMKVRL